MRTSHLWLSIAGCWLLLGASLQAGGWRCPDCGCCEHPCRVRRLVNDVERVVHYEYFSRCETFCVQGPSRCVGEKPKTCGDANYDVPQNDKIWQPTCGRSFSCSRLCKRPVVEERPVVRCVIEDVCSRCGVPHAARDAYPIWARKKSVPAAGEYIAAAPESRSSTAPPTNPPTTPSMAVPAAPTNSAPLQASLLTPLPTVSR